MDKDYMKMALELAARARGRTSPNPMVGAVLVKEDRVIGQGYHVRAGEPHAEVLALAEAGDEARGATLYVTLEPCCHHGRTGPCAEAVLVAGVSRVVAAMADPNPLVAGGGFRLLREAGVDVITGVMEEEARELNEVFLKHVTTGLPFVVAKAAMSLDGKIATRTGQSKWITGPQARAYGHCLRNWYDAILVGIGTVQADNPSLTTRLPDGTGRDPVRIILDSAANTPPTANVLAGCGQTSVIIATTASAAPEKTAALQQAGAEVLVVNEGPRVDLTVLMKLLGERNITSVLIEGGAEVHGSAFAAKIIDKVVWFIAPKIIGGREAPGPVGGLGIGDLSGAALLERIKISHVGPDICIEGGLSFPT